jgi:hypothetical protein
VTNDIYYDTEQDLPLSRSALERRLFMGQRLASMSDSDLRLAVRDPRASDAARRTARHEVDRRARVVDVLEPGETFDTYLVCACPADDCMKSFEDDESRTRHIAATHHTTYEALTSYTGSERKMS